MYEYGAAAFCAVAQRHLLGCVMGGTGALPVEYAVWWKEGGGGGGRLCATKNLRTWFACCTHRAGIGGGGIRLIPHADGPVAGRVSGGSSSQPFSLLPFLQPKLFPNWPLWRRPGRKAAFLK